MSRSATIAIQQSLKFFMEKKKFYKNLMEVNPAIMESSKFMLYIARSKDIKERYQEIKADSGFRRGSAEKGDESSTSTKVLGIEN
jgi:hypothetical protein